MSAGYSFALSCPTCAGDLAHVNGVATGTESTAVACCHARRREWAVRAYLVPLASVEQRQARERQARRRAGLVRA